jgi:Ca2+-binding RTX toxin-like protein
VIEWKKNAIGSNSADTMVGSTRADKINGGLGNDRLKGGDGADFFVFTTKLNAKSNMDTIEDFVSGTDKIQLENAVFTAFKKAGALAASAFALSGKAEDKSDRIIYKQDTGQLFYDKDGTGKAAAVLFATLENKANLTVNDFTVI